jgi:hypothetical protein
MTEQPPPVTPSVPPTPVPAPAPAAPSVPVVLRETTPDAVVDQPEEEVRGQNDPEPEVDHSHDNDQYFHNYWAGRPNFACPHCPHKSLGGTASIEEHIYDYHPEQSGIDFGENIGDTNA